MNTPEEELIMDAHEISMQSAVMSGLEDVNSFQFFTRSNMNSCLKMIELSQKMLSKEY